MRSPNKSRSRNKNNRRGNNAGNSLNRVYDSAGPQGRVRGTPAQVIEKYQSLAHDSALAGDRVATENFQQHAEHYIRLINEAQREIAERRQAQEQQSGNQDRQNGQNTGRDEGRGQKASASDETGGQQPEPVKSKHDGDQVPTQSIETVGEEPQAGLVETPEETKKPARPPRQRRPRATKPATAPQSEEPPAAGE